MTDGSYGGYKHHGLTEVCEADRYGEMYSYSVVGVWWHEETRSYRFSEDGGCSCNAPWDMHYSLDDYGPPLTYAEARKKLQDVSFAGNCLDEKMRAIESLSDFERARKP